MNIAVLLASGVGNRLGTCNGSLLMAIGKDGDNGSAR